MDDITVPDVIDTDWVKDFHERLRSGILSAKPLEEVVSGHCASEILSRLGEVLEKEGTVVDVEPEHERTVVVVGDTHGHFFDFLHLLEETKYYEGQNYYIINGDMVDRGAWGVELFLSATVMKVASPSRIFLLRGNHESRMCTKLYGFKRELQSKYRPSKKRKASSEDGGPCQPVNMGSFLKVFRLLPLAAVIKKNTLVVHGGLWRKPKPRVQKRKRMVSTRQKAKPRASDNDTDWNPPGLSTTQGLQLGSLQDLRSSNKGGFDALGDTATTLIASDALWSDPVIDDGLHLNDTRGVGLLFGPDVTKRFLEENSLKLIVRSHEGPDARFGREDMLPMSQGFTLDHDTDAGKLVTVFSAADYPQFQLDEERLNNKGSVVMLRAPSYYEYDVFTYEPASRPAAECFYELELPGSDDEFRGDISSLSEISEVFDDVTCDNRDTQEVCFTEPGVSPLADCSESAQVQQEPCCEVQLS